MALPLDSCSSNVGVSSAATAAGLGAAGPGSAMGGGSEASWTATAPRGALGAGLALTLWLWHTKSYWKWPFRVDLSMKNGDFLKCYMLVYQRVTCWGPCSMIGSIGSMVLLYMVTFAISIPQMLAYIPAPWILWGMLLPVGAPKVVFLWAFEFEPSLTVIKGIIILAHSWRNKL